MYKKPTAVASAAAEPLPWPFGPHVAGYQIKDNTSIVISSPWAARALARRSAHCPADFEEVF